MCAGSGLYHSTNDTGRKTRRSRPFLARFTVCWATGRYLSGGGVGISEMAEPEKVPTAAKPDNLSLVPGPLYGGRRGPDSCQLSFDLHPRVMRQPPTNFKKKKKLVSLNGCTTQWCLLCLDSRDVRKPAGRSAFWLPRRRNERPVGRGR